MHSAGRIARATKARILPVTPTVTEGRTRNTAASTIVTTINATRISVDPVTTPPARAFAQINWKRNDGGRTAKELLLFGQTPYGADEPLNLVVRQLAFVRRHFAAAHPVRDAVSQLGVGLFLHFSGPQIFCSQ